MPNWLDGERRDQLKAELLNPSGYGHLGWLDGIVAASVSENYESDTRIDARITTVAPNTYIDLAMVRLIHVATFSDGEEWRETLGTFFAMRGGDGWKSGASTLELDLKSALYGMRDDLAPSELTLAKGGQARAAFDLTCAACKRPRLWVDGASDKRFAQNTVLGAGKSYLSRLHEIADLSGNRLGVDALGRVTMSRYVRPHDRAAGLRLAGNSPLVVADQIGRSTDEMEVPGRAVVTWEHSEQVKVRDGTYTSGSRKGQPKYKETTQRRTITAYADAPAGNRAHIDRRGFRVATWHSEDDLGGSQAAAQSKAAEYLAGEDEPTVTWDVPCLYFDVHAGDIILWRPPGEVEYRKCLVRSRDVDLWTYTQKLTLKEV